VTAGREEGGAGARGRLRTSAAEREQAISVLKSAFVQGRLGKDEFDLRVGQVFASRTYADLGAITADIPDQTADVEMADGRVGAASGELEPRPGRVLSVKTAARVGAVGAIPSMVSAAIAMTHASQVPAAVGVLVVALTGVLVTVLLAALLVAGSWVVRRSQRDAAQGPPSGPSGPASRRRASPGALAASRASARSSSRALPRAGQRPAAGRRPPRAAEAVCLGLYIVRQPIP